TTRYRGTDAAPQSLVGSTATGPGSTVYWPDDGLVEGNRLRVFYTSVTQTGTGPLDYQPNGTAVADFTLPDLAPAGFTVVPVSGRISWGVAAVTDGGYTYVYGVEDADPVKYVHVARVAAGDVLGPWEFFTGSGWSVHEEDSARVLGGVGHGF